MNPRTLGTPPGSAPRKRTPLGRLCARLRAGDEPRAVLREALGGEFGDRFADAYVMCDRLEPVARSRKGGKGRADLPRVVWRSERRGDDVRGFEHFAYFVLCVLERMGIDTRKAASAKLWLGDSWHVDALGRRRYTRAKFQIGMAGRVGVCVKELQRYLAVLAGAGLVRSWQPKGPGARAPESMPRNLRGQVYAYQHYQLLTPLPRQLRSHLERFYAKRGAEASASSPAPTAEPAQPVVAPSLDELAEGAAGIASWLKSRPPPS